MSTPDFAKPWFMKISGYSPKNVMMNDTFLWYLSNEMAAFTGFINPGLTLLRYQWPFQDPRLEVPTIYKASFSGLNFREYPHKIWPNIWY